MKDKNFDLVFGEFMDKVVSGQIVLLSDDLKSEIKNVLGKLGFTDEEQDRWLLAFYKHWMANVIKSLGQEINKEEQDHIEEIYNSEGQEGVNSYLQILEVNEPKVFEKYQKVLQDELRKSLHHFLQASIK